MNFNKGTFLGRLTRDVEIRHTQSGTTVGKFGMACNRWRKDKDDEVCFVNVVAFGKTAENLANHVKKGDPLHIEYRLSFSSWEDKNGGGKRSSLELVVESFQFIGVRDERNNASSTKPAEDYDEIPF